MAHMTSTLFNTVQPPESTSTRIDADTTIGYDFYRETA